MWGFANINKRGVAAEHDHGLVETVATVGAGLTTTTCRIATTLKQVCRRGTPDSDECQGLAATEQLRAIVNTNNVAPVFETGYGGTRMASGVYTATRVGEMAAIALNSNLGQGGQ